MFAFNVFLKRGILSRGGCGRAWGQYVQPGGHCRERRRATSCLFVYIGGSGHWQKHNTLNASTLQNQERKEMWSINANSRNHNAVILAQRGQSRKPEER